MVVLFFFYKAIPLLGKSLRGFAAYFPPLLPDLSLSGLSGGGGALTGKGLSWGYSWACVQPSFKEHQASRAIPLMFDNIFYSGSHISPLIYLSFVCGSRITIKVVAFSVFCSWRLNKAAANKNLIFFFPSFCPMPKKYHHVTNKYHIWVSISDGQSSIPPSRLTFESLPIH